jgi:membrane protease YdiL (CAAX protease family)
VAVPRPRRWPGALVTGVAACLLTAFVALAVQVHLAGSRLDSIDDPPRALALIVERTMDLEDALTGAATWERRFYELTVTDGRNELEEAIAWYEELADVIPGEPGVQVRRAVLYGEAGRTDEVLETVDRWRARGDTAWADVLSAAYLDAPLNGALARLRDTAGRMVAPGWFRDRLLLRLAERAGDSAGRAAIVASARARTLPLLRRVRALTAAELLMLGAGLAGLFMIVRGRAVRVDSALVPPPWRLGEGLVVLVRGAGAGVLVLVGVYLIGRWRGPNDPLLAAISMPLMYAPMLWLARRQLFAPAGVGLVRGLGWLPAPGGRRALVWTTALLVGMGTATDVALGLLSETMNVSAHWTEWFDEDLAWGAPLVAGASLLGTVVFAPLFEEIVFRGLLYATLRRRLAWPIAATVSAGIFAIAHGYGAAGFGSVFLSGLLWAIAYERTGSLLPNMAAHVLNNAAAALGVLLLLRG